LGVFRADAADDDLEGSVFACGEQLQLVEDRDFFPFHFPEAVRRAVVEQQVAEAMLRLRQRDAIDDRPRRIDPSTPDHFGLFVWIDSNRRDADFHLDRAFAFGDVYAEPFPRAARLGPIFERRRGDAQIPPGVPLRRVERDRLLIAAQRFLPVALLFAQQAEVVPGRRPRGPELDRLLVILDRLGDQATLLELDGLLVVADRQRLRRLIKLMDFHFAPLLNRRGARRRARDSPTRSRVTKAGTARRSIQVLAQPARASALSSRLKCLQSSLFAPHSLCSLVE